MKRSLLAAGAVGCLLGFYLVALGVVAGLSFAAFRIVVDTGPGPAALIVVCLLGISVLLGTMISSVLRQPVPEAAGLLLEQENHPDLWAEVVRVAEQVGTRAPDEIRLTATPEITVTEDAGRLGLIGGTRRLALGVPLLLTLTRSESQAVLARELALWRGGSLGLSATAHRGQLTLSQLASRQRGASAMGMLLDRCARLYQRVAHHEIREQELDADRAGAQVAGSGPMIAAIRQLPAVELLWKRYTRNHAYAAPGLRPLRLFEGFSELWAQDAVQTELAEIRDEPVEPARTPYSSHATADERLDLLLESPVRLPVDDSPAHLMVRRAGWHTIELEASMFRTSPLQAATWDEIADAVGRHQVGVLAAAMPEPLDLCVTDLDDGPARVLTQDLLPSGASPCDVRTAAVDLVTAAIEAALLERGEARIVASWLTTWRLVDEDGRSLDIATLVSGAYDDAALRESLSEFVRTEGLADYRAGPVETPAGPLAATR